MSEIYQELGHFVRGLQQQLKNSAAITLTPDDHQNLYIHIDKQTRTRINPPDFAPVLTLIRTEHLICEFQAVVPYSDEVDHIALPKHMKLGRKIAVVPAGTPPTEANYHTIDSVGRSKFRITFAPAEADMDGYLICAYYNPRGENGPESKPLQFRII